MDEGTPRFRYDARLANEIELRWQDRWDREGTFESPNPVGPLSDGFARVADRPKFYLLDFFPYPSGIGLHVGHPLGYIGTDVFGRYLRMTGHHVLHPFGFDTFGLPAEQYAIDTGQHPAVTVQHNADAMRRQLRRLGLGHDRRREILTSDPSFYRWTQWIFLQIFNSWFDPDAGPQRGGQLSRVPQAVAPVAAAHHLLRRAAAGRPGRRGLAGEHQAPAAELDRPERGAVPPAGLAVLAAAVLGRAVPRRVRRGRPVPADRAARTDAARHAAGHDRLPAGAAG